MNGKLQLLKAAALVAAVAALASGCADDAQLREIAQREGITLQEAKNRQLTAANDVDEAIPGSVSGFIRSEYGGGD